MKHQNRLTFGGLMTTVGLMIFTAFVLLPFAWMILLSFKTNADILTNPYGLPTKLDFKNYIQLFMDPGIAFYRYFLNSIYVSVAAVILTLVLSSLGGYAFGRSRFKFKGRDFVLAILLFSLMLPVQATYIPQFVLMSQYGLLNSHLGLILLYAAYQVTVSTILFKAYFGQLPDELDESARMDGAGEFRIYFNIMLPLTKPVIVSVMLLNFLSNWNELILAMTMITSPLLRTLPVALMNFVGESSSNYAMAAAALVSGMLPVLIVYALFSDKIEKGLTEGAVKG